MTSRSPGNGCLREDALIERIRTRASGGAPSVGHRSVRIMADLRTDALSTDVLAVGAAVEIGD